MRLGASAARARAHESGIELKFQSEAKLPVLRGDALRIKQVIINLMTNAIKYGHEGGHATLILTKDDSTVKFCIKDNGPGMSPEFVSEELFKPFRSSKGVTGMGIGAYQAKTNIKNCGGQLDVASEVGVGTTFSIRFSRSEQ